MAEKKSHNAPICQDIADGKRNPFWTMEAALEHTNMLWGWYGKQGYQAPFDEHGQREDNRQAGDFSHELLVVERYIKDARDTFAALEPLLYAASEGDESALLLLRDHLLQLKEKHQRDWHDYNDA